MSEPLKAPFPWFGGKSKVAHLVWDRFGDVPNYCEPFFGSGAVLLNRPHDPGIETVNDKDAFLSNFWRAIQFNPSVTAVWADWPVNEVDLAARHAWLLQQPEFIERLRSDPEFYDCRIAGWWAHGICSTIGEAFLRRTPQQPAGNLSVRGFRAAEDIPLAFMKISARLSRVNVLCGDWIRAVSESRTTNIATTGVFLDPPYESDCYEIEYSTEKGLSASVAAWAIKNGDNPQLRIALCGYDGEHAMPASWECIAWKARGGYGSQSDGRGRENSDRERIWFSPHCLKPQESLFAGFFDGEATHEPA